MRVKNIDRLIALCSKAKVRANTRLLEAFDRMKMATRDVDRRGRVVMIDAQIRVGQNRQAGRVKIGFR